jgi:1-acyl-sn-glycerol-3-phosphate acyltransferase
VPPPSRRPNPNRAANRPRATHETAAVNGAAPGAKTPPPASRGAGQAKDSQGGLRGLIARRAEDWSLEGDERFMERQRHLWNFVMDHYFRMEVEGWHRLPEAPALLIGIHASGVLPIEAYTTCFAWYRHFGAERPIHGTSHDVTFATPLLGDFMRKLGALPASPHSIGAALEAGHDVIVWPGGDRDALRPWRQRDRVVLGGRHGFIKQAINSGVPIVPVATVGGADTLFVLTRGRGLAKRLRLNKLLRTDVLPVAAGLPFGVAPALIPQFPLPAKIRTEFLDPIELDGDRARAEDDRYVHRKYEQVERALQDGVDRLAARRSFPIFG